MSWASSFWNSSNWFTNFFSGGYSPPPFAVGQMVLETRSFRVSDQFTFRATDRVSFRDSAQESHRSTETVTFREVDHV